MRRPRWLVRGVVSLAVLAAVTGALPGVVGASAAAVRPASAPSWSRCPDAVGSHPAQCADIRVPLSWARPGGRTISLHLSRLPALDPAHRVGVLLFNPGGPGGPGAETVAEAGRNLFTPSLQRRFDIIGFDPRGVGKSTAVRCTGAALSARVPVFPRTSGQFAAIARHSAAYAAGCAAHSVPGLLAHVDTVSAARDVDAIRGALHQRRINWLGLSYGTYLGQTYARLFPHRVRAMVLDGAIDHATGPRAFLWQEASSLSAVFGRFARWCGSSTSCALHGQDVLAGWDQLLARAARQPLPAPHATGGPTTVSADAIRMVLPNLLLFGPSSPLTTWPTLGKALAAAQAGDASLLADNSAVGRPQPAYTAVGCQDFPPQFHGYRDAAARLAVARAVSPHTGGASEAWEVADLCAGWPVRPADPWAYQPIVGAPPILVASASHDPSTPLAWALGLHREIAGSGLLIADVTGHTAYANSACARSTETTYLLTDRLPANDHCDA
ncbi:MAG: alpha/beta hydrolase [Sciscionella sp.]